MERFAETTKQTYAGWDEFYSRPSTRSWRPSR